MPLGPRTQDARIKPFTSSGTHYYQIRVKYAVRMARGFGSKNSADAVSSAAGRFATWAPSSAARRRPCTPP